MAKITKNRFTASVIIPGKNQPKYIPDCTIYKGKLVQIISVGVGTPVEKGGINQYGEGETWEEYSSYTDKMKPVLSIFLMGDRIDYFKKLLAKSNHIITPENEEELLSVSFTMGENAGGYVVSNFEDYKRKLEEERMLKVQNKEIPIIITESTFGLSISERLPTDIWNKLKPYAKYWSADDIDEWYDDMDDFHKVGEGRYMKGWYYTKEIIDILEKEGFTLEKK